MGGGYRYVRRIIGNLIGDKLRWLNRLGLESWKISWSNQILIWILIWIHHLILHRGDEFNSIRSKFNQFIQIPSQIGQIQLKSLKNGWNQLKMSNSIDFLDWIQLFWSFNLHFKHSFWSKIVEKDHNLFNFNLISTSSFNQSLNWLSYFKSDRFRRSNLDGLKSESSTILFIGPNCSS